ncbi:hypothetical protein BDV18DRAFT_21205 [Aspergillus unguis]
MSQYTPIPLAGDRAGAAPYMFGQPSYASLFRASEERPQLNNLRRWWESDINTILWSFDLEEIRRVIRYGLSPDENHCWLALQRRPPNTILDFLSALVKPQDRPYYARLPHEKKLEEIIHRCRLPTPPVMVWGWLPLRRDSGLDPLVIAKAIDTESHVHFARITFEEMVRYSLGYSCNRVDWFLQQHSCLYAHLLDHLSAFPEEAARYAEVENHLRCRSPFAHRAVACALQSAGFQLDLLTMRRPGFEFFAAPIQRLFKELSPNLSSIMKVLSVLGVRFERTYLHAREMDWSRQFSIAFSFLEDVLDSSSSTDFASDFPRTLTSSDENDFAPLLDEEALNKSVAIRLAYRWEVLSIEVWECCKALPEIIPHIQGSLVPLLQLRNYHSLTAILSGLHKYSISETSHIHTGNENTALALNQMLPPELLYLLEPSQNFAAYREQYQQAPGIPFLIPHLNEYDRYGEPVFQHLYGQLRPILPKR